MSNKNTYQELTLNFYNLLQVKNNQPKLYDRFMKVLQNKEFDIVFDSLTVLYVGYLCANLNSESVLTEEDFIAQVPFNLEKINIVAGALIQSKKK